MSDDIFVGFYIVEKTTNEEISIKSAYIKDEMKDSVPISDALDFFNHSFSNSKPNEWIFSTLSQYNKRTTEFFIAKQREDGIVIECIIVLSICIDEIEHTDENCIQLIGKKLILYYMNGNEQIDIYYLQLLNNYVRRNNPQFNKVAICDDILGDTQFLATALTSHLETGMRTIILTDEEEEYIKIVGFLSNFVYDNQLKLCKCNPNPMPNEFQFLQSVEQIKSEQIDSLVNEYTIIHPKTKKVFTSLRKTINVSPWALDVIKLLQAAEPENRQKIAEQKLCEIMRASIGFIGIADEKIRTSGSEKLSEKQLIEISQTLGMTDIEDAYITIGIARLHKNTLFTKVFNILDS